MNGWFNDSKTRLMKDAIRRCSEGLVAGEYVSTITFTKNEDGEISIIFAKLKESK
jgi:hypothetical protein